MSLPNLIVIYCDDLGYGDLGCYGSPYIQTPHLDRLAEQGVRFTDCYSNSPVCSPSRASLLTGLYPRNAGVTGILNGKRGSAGLSPHRTTLAAMLKPHGYRTAAFGKWHLGTDQQSSPNAHGFDSFFGFRAGCVDYYSHIYYWAQGSGTNPVHDLWENDKEIWRNGQYMTELITERTVQFIQESGDEPFFAYVAYNAPHYPMHAPDKYMERYRHLPWDRQVMAAMIAAVDDGVGEIVRALQQAGCDERTVIFFSSDNGPSTESRNWLDGNEDLYYGGTAGIFKGHKASLFEGGIREPAILSYPAGIRGGQTCDRPCMMFDFVPTFLELAGLDAPESNAAARLDGRSVIPMLNGKADRTHERLFWEYNDQLAVREGKWKLVLDGKLDFDRKVEETVCLSDLEQDPGERINLSGNYPELTERLAQEAKQWLRELSTGTDEGL